MTEVVSAVQSAAGLQIREDPDCIAVIRKFADNYAERADSIANKLKLIGFIANHDMLNVQKDREVRAIVTGMYVERLNSMIAELSELSASMKEAAVKIERGEVA